METNVDILSIVKRFLSYLGNDQHLLMSLWPKNAFHAFFTWLVKCTFDHVYQSFQCTLTKGVGDFSTSRMSFPMLPRSWILCIASFTWDLNVLTINTQINTYFNSSTGFFWWRVCSSTLCTWGGSSDDEDSKTVIALCEQTRGHKAIILAWGCGVSSEHLNSIENHLE